MDSHDELRFTRTLLTETVLVWADNVVSVKELHQVAVYDVFQQFTGNRSEGNRSVVRRFALLTLLENWRYIGFFPVIWHFSLVERGLKDQGEGWCKWMGHLLQKT